MTDWATITLGDVTVECSDRLRRNTGVVSVYGVDRSVGLTATPKYQAEDLSRYKVIKPGEFAYNPMRLNIGSIGYCAKHMQSGCVSPDYIVFRCVDGLDSDYLAAYMKGPQWITWTGSAGVGSVRQRIYYRELARMPLSLPSLKQQRAIAEVLRSLDDKMELNRRMNRTLEQMAAAIFKAWFVDFEPVKAKAAGATRFPTMPQPVFDALPTEFTDSPLGPIPKGWQIGSPLTLADLLSGGTPKSSEPSYWNGSVPWASAKDVSQCGEAFLIATDRCISELGLANSSTKLIEPFSTVIVARGATTGRFTMFGETISMNQTCYALRSKAAHHFFVYCWFASIRDQLVHTAHGSVFDTITTSTFKTASVSLPPQTISAAFDASAKPIFECVLSNLRQNVTLADIRDALLPKLLSGEVRVGAAEKLLGEVA